MTVQVEPAAIARAQDAEADGPAESRLVARARDGDCEAFDALVALHMERVYRLAYRLCWHHEDAVDITQETFLRAFKRLRKLRADTDFAQWIYRIAVNRCLSYRARHARTATLQPTPEPSGPVSDDPGLQAEARATSSRVREEIRRLPRRQQAAIVLFALEGRTVEETAAVMGCAAGTVKRHLHRARATLRGRLQDLCDDVSGERC
ncbi:MAG: RNA polymerase sigma factor, partial [Armatimonadota bacterium]